MLHSFAASPGIFWQKSPNDMRVLKYLGFALLVLAIVLLLLYRFWFLRLPDREVPQDTTVFVSPANGVIGAVQPWNGDTTVIEKGLRKAVIEFTGFVGDSGHLVSIIMNVHNVHYQRAPIGCTLIAEEYMPGRFNNAVQQANRYDIRFENERNSLLFETANGIRFKVIQIAGLLARRIEDYVEPGQTLQQGEVIGLIKLGSQVTLVLPAQVQIEVQPGQVVIDGETVIARLAD